AVQLAPRSGDQWVIGEGCLITAHYTMASRSHVSARRSLNTSWLQEFSSLCPYTLSVVPLLGFWLWALTKKRFSERGFFAAVILSAFVLKGLPLELFPVTAKRSDMLPILYESGTKLLQWDNPYQYYLLDNGVQTLNVRFPGLILAYLPAVAVGFDLRWITLGYEFVFWTVVGLFAFPSRNLALPNHGLLAVLSVFVLLPYWHYRHELYEIPFWVALFATLYALHRGAVTAFTIGLGLLIATHQWGCLFWPFFLVFVMRKQGWKPAIYSGLGSIILGSAVFFIVTGVNFLDFYEHTFSTYKRIIANEEVYPMSMYLTPYVVKLISASSLLLLQAFLQVMLLIVAFHMNNSLSALCGIAALSLITQLLFNPVGWTYQYLLVVNLLILGSVFRAGAENQPEPSP
ncbi:MAG: hypothetical protein ACREQA_11465, partial [Candidatus Binatia bacterium]